MEILAAAVCGFCLDLVLGDPEGFPHPVVQIGKTVTFLERFLRRCFPDTPSGRRHAGKILALLVPFLTWGAAFAALRLAGLMSRHFRFALEVLWSWQCLAMCCLRKESENVMEKLNEGSVDQARAAVARIVGRDTDALDAEGIVRAAVESVAENFSDGEIAPMVFLMLGGAPLALCYKAVNTMDSMVGYKNERYLDFGRAAARLDDAANWIPSRLSALLLIAAAPLAGLDGKKAFRVWRRDRRNHASPNSAQTEAAMAGALGVRLGGPACYFGKRVEKPWIGDPERRIGTEDIARANRVMYLAGILGLILLGLFRFAAL